MSSLQALVAKVARLEAELESEREKNKEQEQKVNDLAAKLARRDATLRSLRRFLIAASQNFAEVFQQIDREIESEGASEEQQTRKKLTRKVPSADYYQPSEVDRSFDAVGRGKDPTIDSGEEEPSAQRFEARESPVQTEEGIEETDKDKRHDPTLRPLSDTVVSHQPGLGLTWPHPIRCAFMVKFDKK